MELAERGYAQNILGPKYLGKCYTPGFSDQINKWIFSNYILFLLFLQPTVPSSHLLSLYGAVGTFFKMFVFDIGNYLEGE